MEIKNNPRTRKSARLESMQPHFYQGRVFIKKDMENLKGELLMYPRGKHDDLLDGLYYAMKGAYKPISSQINSASSDSDVRSESDKNWAIL
jgi:phage terminase large subunit-like protein